MHVSLEHVSKRYGGFDAVVDVTLELPPGELVALVGANGAGKTTLLRCLAGILAPQQGRILYDGQEFDRERLDLRRRFGMLADTPPFVPAATPIEYVVMMLRLYERNAHERKESVIGWFREMGLLAAADCKISTLSRGERYKTALIGLLACDPELWLLDEPLASGMDPAGLNVLKREMNAAAARGRTVVYTTQLLDIAEVLANRILILSHGKLIADGTLAELRRQARAAENGSLAQVFAELHA